MVERFDRFKDAVWFPKEEDLKGMIVGGAGGIGSWLSMLLTRAGFLPVVYDFDNIESHNLGGQLFSTKHIGKSKTQALSEIVKDLTSSDLSTFNEPYGENSMVSEWMFSGFDNMAARKVMFEKWVNMLKAPQNADKRETAIFIDGRLTLDQATIFCVTAKQYSNIERYRKFLFDDSEVKDAPCTLKQTSHSAALIAAHMVAFFTNHVANIKLGAEAYEVPFFWEYYIPANLVNDEPTE